MSSLEDMSAVQSTEMVRDVAGGAQSELTAINATLEEDPGAKGADRLTTLRDAHLGHADPGFTQRTYTHLMEGSSERTKRAIDAVFGTHSETEDDVDEDDDEEDAIGAEDKQTVETDASEDTE